MNTKIIHGSVNGGYNGWVIDGGFVNKIPGVLQNGYNYTLVIFYIKNFIFRYLSNFFNTNHSTVDTT